MSSEDGLRRLRLSFEGEVQGVGFRWTARKVANEIGATGWVRNEWDGSVSMEIQGTEEQIDAVIMAIERGTFVHIENMDARTVPVEESEYGFSVR